MKAKQKYFQYRPIALPKVKQFYIVIEQTEEWAIYNSQKLPNDQEKFMDLYHHAEKGSRLKQVITVVMEEEKKMKQNGVVDEWSTDCFKIMLQIQLIYFKF